MIERFDEMKRKTISSYAQTAHDIEYGTVNQRNLNDFYNEDHEYYRDELRILGFWEDAEMLGFSQLEILKEFIRSEYPDMEEAYLPFAIADLLKEAYEADNKEDKTNE